MTTPVQRCTKCGELKPLDDFHFAGKGRRRTQCKACAKIRAHEHWEAHRNPNARRLNDPYLDQSTHVMVKRCPTCDEVKPLTEYYTNCKGGRFSSCKVCARRLSRERSRTYQRDSEQRRAYMQQYAEANKERLRAQRAQYYLDHKEYHNEAAARWHKANPDKVKEASLRFYYAHKDEQREYQRSWRKANPSKNYDRVRRRHIRLYHATKAEKVDRMAIYLRDDCVCYLCGIVCTPGVDLTLDHVIPLSRGGTHTPDNLRVACRSCNSRKGTRLLSEIDPREWTIPGP